MEGRVAERAAATVSALLQQTPDQVPSKTETGRACPRSQCTPAPAAGTGPLAPTDRAWSDAIRLHGVGWGYSCFFFFFLPLSAEVSVEVAAESDVAVVSGVVAVGVVAVSGAGVAAGAVAVDGSVVGAGMVVDGVVCGVVGAGVVWANATPETPTIRAPASVRNFIRYSPVLNGPKRKRLSNQKAPSPMVVTSTESNGLPVIEPLARLTDGNSAVLCSMQ